MPGDANPEPGGSITHAAAPAAALLTEPPRDEVDRLQALLDANATIAAIAIDNARLYAQSERGRRWQQAATEVARALLAAETERPIDVVLQCAMDAAAGDLALLVLESRDEHGVDHFTIEAVVGASAPLWQSFSMPLAGTALESIFRDGAPVLVPEVTHAPHVSAEQRRSMHSLLIVPLATDDGARGAIAVGRRTGALPFEPGDLDAFAGFADHAGLALRQDRARSDRETLRVLREHDRIAAELHHNVVRDLFAAGIGVQSVRSTVTRPEDQARLDECCERIDAVIARIRSTVFTLEPDAPR
jgi:GAF domain-containing protein